MCFYFLCQSKKCQNLQFKSCPPDLTTNSEFRFLQIVVYGLVKTLLDVLKKALILCKKRGKIRIHYWYVRCTYCHNSWNPDILSNIMGNDIGSGVLFNFVCFDLFSTNLSRQLSNLNLYFKWFWWHYPLLTYLSQIKPRFLKNVIMIM